MVDVLREYQVLKKQTIKVPAKKESTREVVTYGCDICGDEGKQTPHFRTCYSCKRLFCYTYKKRCGYEDPHEMGDYPDKYCKICYDLKYTKYKHGYDHAEAEYEDAIDSLDNIVKKESLNHDR